MLRLTFSIYTYVANNLIIRILNKAYIFMCNMSSSSTIFYIYHRYLDDSIHFDVLLIFKF